MSFESSRTDLIPPRTASSLSNSNSILSDAPPALARARAPYTEAGRDLVGAGEEVTGV